MKLYGKKKSMQEYAKWELKKGQTDIKLKS